MLKQPLFLGDRVQAPTPYGYIFLHPDDVSITTWIAGGEGWEMALTELWQTWITPGCTVVDIGANCGWFSLAAKAAGAAEIHSFECNPEMARLLRLTSLINPTPKGWHVHAEGISDTPRSMKLHFDRTLIGGATLGQADGESVVVPVQPLDAYGLSNVAAIKIDVEGHEWHAWQGMQQTLARSPGCRILMEWNRPCLEGNGVALADFATELTGRYRVTHAESGHVVGADDIVGLGFGNLVLEV